MSLKAVITANQTHARFWLWDSAESLDGQHQRLQETAELMNPMDPGLAKGVWANPKSGRNRGASSQAHGYDDHRQNHLDEFERRFCSAIAAQGKQLIEQHQIRTVIVAAPPEVLGHIRREIQTSWPKSFKVKELPKDLMKHSSHELQQYLVKRNLLPVAA